MTVTWLADGGFRVGEFCGLHLADLHLREAAGCGECRSPHVHVCHREANPNRARAKTKHGWRTEDGIVHGGLIRRASPAMIHAYFEYMTAEYPPDAGHGMLLVQLHGPRAGEPSGPGRGPRHAAPRRDPRGAGQDPALTSGGTGSRRMCSRRPAGTPSSPVTPEGGRRPPRWSRSTGTLTCTTRCSRLRSRTCGTGSCDPAAGGAGRRGERTRAGRDRLQLLSALIAAPGFDPVFRPDLIEVPRVTRSTGGGARSRVRARGTRAGAVHASRRALAGGLGGRGQPGGVPRGRGAVQEAGRFGTRACRVCPEQAGRVRRRPAVRASQDALEEAPGWHAGEPVSGSG